jgi:hypothetical protein
VRNGKIHVELLGKFRSSEEFDRSNFARSRSIDRNFLELTFAEERQNTQSGASP